MGFHLEIEYCDTDAYNCIKYDISGLTMITLRHGDVDYRV